MEVESRLISAREMCTVNARVGRLLHRAQSDRRASLEKMLLAVTLVAVMSLAEMLLAAMSLMKSVK